MSKDLSLSMKSEDFSAIAKKTIAELENKTLTIFSAVKEEDIWQAITSPSTSDSSLRDIVKNVFLSIYSYQRHTTEAGFLMISRLPKSEHALLSALVHHKLDEAEHGEWALRDFIKLGGRPDDAHKAISPASFSVSATWWRMATVEDPFGYLGAEYLFEYLTALACEPVMQQFQARGFSSDGFGFIVEHATEDVKHTNLLRHLVGYTVTKFPESRQSMLRCFDYFAQVYPIPVWNEAYGRVSP